jgi:hypothetical protein
MTSLHELAPRICNTEKIAYNKTLLLASTMYNVQNYYI